MNSSDSVPPIQRKRKARDLTNAVMLRPRDVFELYGISQPTLWRITHTGEASDRLPATFIGSRKGRMGLTLIKRSDLDAYLAKHSNGGKLFDLA